MYSKAQIFNLALSHLLLSEQVSDTETNKVSNNVKVLNLHWETALNTVLQELDLDSLSEPIPLELMAELKEGPWNYVYKYPSRCVYIRRIVSGVRLDNSDTFIAKRTGLYQGKKAIFTNEYKAILECITNDIPLEALTPSAGMALSLYLASLSSPLITGKGAARLRESLFQQYLIHLDKARGIDQLENFNYDCPAERSEFVRVRMS